MHSSVCGHLGCFHYLDIVNSDAMNIAVNVSFWFMVLSGYMPSSGIAVSYGNSIVSFIRNSIMLSTVTVSIYIPNNSGRGFLISTHSPAFVVCRFSDDAHSNRCEMIHHGWVHFVEQRVGLVYYIFGLWNGMCANFNLWFYTAPQLNFPLKQA